MKKVTLVIVLLVSLSFTGMQPNGLDRVNHAKASLSNSKEEPVKDTLKNDSLVVAEKKEIKNIEDKVDVELSKGLVSWYGGKFHGRSTSSGEKFNMNELTAAHKTLPFGTKVRIINPKNGKEVVVRITDRGPFTPKREFDLSKAAFAELTSLDSGILNVKYEVIKD